MTDNVFTFWLFNHRFFPKSICHFIKAHGYKKVLGCSKHLRRIPALVKQTILTLMTSVTFGFDTFK